VNYLAPGGQSAVLWNQRQAGRLFSEIRSDQPVIKAAPKRHRSASHRHGRSAGTPASAHHPAGWVPPGARTAAQAACTPTHR
jgi:hypothetical protein